MKLKLLNLGLLISSLFGYLEWGQGNHSFLFQAEVEVLRRLFSEPMSVVHPLTIIPFAGQLLLLVTLFQRKPAKLATIAAIVCLGILLGLMFVIGFLSQNIKILVSVIPFLALASLSIREQFKK